MKEPAIGPYAATALVVANMVGTGVFTTSGLLLKEVGTPRWVLLAWLLGGMTALLGALCYGALAKQFPESGGEYLYLSKTFPSGVAYVAGWITLLVGFAIPLAALADAFAAYVQHWVPAGVPPQAVGSLLLLVAAGLHLFSISVGARLQAIVVGVEILLIVLLASFGLGRLYADGAPIQNGAGRPVGLGVALILVSYSYTGWNGAAYIASEIRGGGAKVARVLVAGTVLVTVLYLALNTFFVYAAPLQAVAGRIDVGHVAAEYVGGPRLAFAVSGLVALAVAMCVSALTMTGPQVASRMARDGILPMRFAGRPGTPPRWAIVAQLGLGLVALWSAAFDAILAYVGILLGLCTAMTVVGLIRLRLRQGATVAIPGWPWVPGLFLLFMVGATLWTVALRPSIGLTSLLTVAVFAIIHRVNARRRR